MPQSLENWLSGIGRLRKVILSVTESKAECWKERSSVTLTRQSQLNSIKLLKMVFSLLLWWCPFKIQTEKRAGLQFTSTDYLSQILTPLRIRRTIPLRYSEQNWASAHSPYFTLFSIYVGGGKVQQKSFRAFLDCLYLLGWGGKISSCRTGPARPIISVNHSKY